MKRLTVLTAAVAVSLSSLAANARDFHRPDVEALEAAFAEATKAEQQDPQEDAKAEEQDKGDGPATASVIDDAAQEAETEDGHEIAAPVVDASFSFRPGEGTPSQNQTAAVAGTGDAAAAAVDVDPMTTASVEQAADKSAEPASKAAVLVRAGEGTPTKGDKQLIATTRESAQKKAAVLKGGGKYQEIVSRYASAYGVPVQLAHAVITIESNYRASATGSAGEVGLMQIKPSTARMMGYSGSAKGLYNPETNIKFGMKYLAKAHELGGGTTCGTILRYNAGHGAKRMNPVSAAYCSKVKRHLASI